VQDQPVVRIAAERLRNDFLELGFHLVDGLAGGETGAIADPEHMGVDGEGLLAERGVEHDISGLSADARQRLQIFAVARDFAAEAVDQSLAERDDVFRLGVEQADGLDRLAELFLAEADHLPRSRDPLEQRPRRDVDARIRGLSGQNDGDEQLVSAAGFELRRW
jgi:hypothetical protein